MCVEGATPENELVLEQFKLHAQATSALWSRTVPSPLQLLLRGVHVVHEVKGQGVLVSSCVIRTATIDKMFGEARGVRGLRIAR